MASSASFRVLVTGFGTYGNTKLNPSLSVIRSLQSEGGSQLLPGVNVVAREVTSEFFTCIRETEAMIAQLRPDSVVMLGEYPGRSMVTLERVAINFNDATRYGLRDEAGFAPQGTPTVEGGGAPAAYFSTLPLRRIVKDLRNNGVPADISGDAGTLMCNHLMYGVLHKLAAEFDGEASNTAAGWVHLPALPETAALEENLGMPSMTAELSTMAVKLIVESIASTARSAGGEDIDEPIRSRLLV
mmetsp:Transcript_23994/g.66670  ORF Transcript_23994/g.66670 Transcript_23994/m.66670 type:complete len:243 (-) Transcript_23994:720-1448(-)